MADDPSPEAFREALNEDKAPEAPKPVEAPAPEPQALPPPRHHSYYLGRSCRFVYEGHDIEGAFYLMPENRGINVDGTMDGKAFDTLDELLTLAALDSRLSQRLVDKLTYLRNAP